MAIKNRRREPGRDRKILRNYRQDGNVAVRGIGNLEPHTLRSIGRKTNKNKKRVAYVERCTTRRFIGAF